MAWLKKDHVLQTDRGETERGTVICSQGRKKGRCSDSGGLVLWQSAGRVAAAFNLREKLFSTFRPNERAKASGPEERFGRPGKSVDRGRERTVLSESALGFFHVYFHFH